MFEMGGAGGIGNIGERNVRSVEAIMRTEQIHIMKKDVGLNYARTMMIDVDTGIVRVRTAGRQERGILPILNIGLYIREGMAYYGKYRDTFRIWNE